MKRLEELYMGIAAVLMAGCFSEAAVEDEVEDELTVASVDFESYPTGLVGSPWTVTSAGSASTVRVVGTTDHGHVLLLRGGTAVPDYVIAALGISSASTEITAQVDINPASDASFLWSLHGAGTSIGRRRIRLQREPGSTALIANTVPGGNSACGTLPSNQWSQITLRVHAQGWPHTFDVLIDGARTACTGLPTGLGPPFRSIDVMDASNEGWGGEVRFDNLAVATP